MDANAIIKRCAELLEFYAKNQEQHIKPSMYEYSASYSRQYTY